MSFQNRKQKIVKILEESNEEVTVSQIALDLNTSEITVRRDFNLMAKTGEIIRTHGGAMSHKLINSTISFIKKNDNFITEKEYIAKIAAKEIQDGDIIFMDCGSTVFKLCQFIKSKKIKVITNSLPVIYELKNTGIQLNLIGGEIDTDRDAIHGLMAVEHIKKYKVDKAFIGVDGLSLNGLFANSEKEASITLAMIEQSNKNYLLCDESKLDKETNYNFSKLSKIDVLVTNAQSIKLEKYRKSKLIVLN